MISALLTAGYLLPIVTDAFFPGDDYDYSGVIPFHMPLEMRIPLLFLSAGAILTGLFANYLIDFAARCIHVIL